ICFISCLKIRTFAREKLPGCLHSSMAAPRQRYIRMNKIHFQERLEERHIGPSADETADMLDTLGLESLGQLMDETVPAQIRTTAPLHLPDAWSETAYLQRMRAVADKNRVFKSYIGQG